ncbi:hypothetical protein AB0D30_36610 [Streptomyces sp. NPDC048409]|uniref:hypothetical protein n=1 Tax=Streptomyces sp. NPDC048409 TaxID=3154723 RepID=UPI0034263018
MSNGRCGKWRDYRRQVVNGVLNRVRTGVQWRGRSHVRVTAAVHSTGSVGCVIAADLSDPTQLDRLHVCG